MLFAFPLLDILPCMLSIIEVNVAKYFNTGYFIACLLQEMGSTDCFAKTMNTVRKINMKSTETEYHPPEQMQQQIYDFRD